MTTPLALRAASRPAGERASFLPDPLAPLSEVERAQVEQAVRTINRTLVTGGLRIAVEIRNYVLDEFCDGRYDLFVNPKHSKQAAFAALCQHPDLRVGADMLRLWVRVGEQLRHMDPELAWQLSVEHHRALLPLADAKARELLAERAIVEELTAAQLSEAVAQALANPPSRGRPRTTTTLRHLSAAQRAIRAVDVERIRSEAGRWTDQQRATTRERALAWKSLAEQVLAALAE
ncbi:MAG: hypothetical protein HY902_18410 [Deltaproteobacteria bacterium]|nr:hypothetical protein [Deltaproteobacteria bacterium]